MIFKFALEDPRGNERDESGRQVRTMYSSLSLMLCFMKALSVMLPAPLKMQTG